MGVALLQEDETEQHGREVERLERALADRARELRETRSELERRAVLIRDLTARWASGPVNASEDVNDIEQLRSERDQAVGRALEAEASAMEARFRIDELAGHLAGAAAKVHEPDLAQLERDARLAELDGTVRGLRSRLAQTEDARDRAEARLMLMEHDLEDANAQGVASRRLVAELGERLEGEELRARTVEAEVVGLRGELLGLSHRAIESERGLTTIRDEWIGLRAVSEQVKARVFVALAERDAVRAVIDSTRLERDKALADAFEARGQVTSLQDELAEREADLATIRASQGGSMQTRERAMSFQETLLDARQALRDLSAWLAGEGAGALVASTTSFELDTPLGVSNHPPREDETMPGVPLHVQAIAAVESMAVEALEEQLAQKDDQLRALEARLDEILRRQGLI